MRKNTSKRCSRRTREQWQALIENYNANPIDPQTYCDRSGITINRFLIWRRRFGQSGFVELPGNPIMQASGTCVAEMPAEAKHWDIELSFGNEMTLRMRTQ